MKATASEASALPPLIDVLIPIFNAERYAADAIGSIQNQTVQNIVLHLIDDGSTDGTPDILKRIARDDERVRVYTRINGGIVDALNFGLERCTAEFVARHDADDLAVPGRFAAQLKTFEESPDLVATASAARHIGSSGEELGTATNLRDPALNDPYAFPAREPYLLHPFLMVRRGALVAAGGYRHVVHAEDSDLYWRLIEVGRLYSDPAELGAYRMHAESISSRSIENGRVLSVSSQLAALSAIRRREKRADLTFSAKSAQAIRKGAGSLESLCRLAQAELSDAERIRFRLSAASKLLEVAGYRPFELTAEDCVFFDKAYRAGSSLVSKESARTLQRMIGGTAARLASAGRGTDAWTVGRHNPIGFAIRCAFRMTTPAALRRKLRPQSAASPP